MATARIPQPITDDPVKVDPQHYKVEFENERVRVLRIKYGAGEKSVMHSHPEAIAVFLTDAHHRRVKTLGSVCSIRERGPLLPLTLLAFICNDLRVRTRISNCRAGY